MKERLERSGLRSISAVVDVTNYVMLEMGQPLHAYDDRLLDGSVVVRFAREGETLTLLNGQVLQLDADLLMVCDEKKPLGLAGIMGGEHSGIADDTTRVYLEGAFWNPAVVQGKMKRLGFTSDAGYRFERGVDFGGCARAVERATELIVAVCGGRAGPLTDVAGPLPKRDPVKVRPERVTRILGLPLGDDVIADAFTRLGFAFERAGADFIVTPPTYRFDLSIEEDFVEEVARMYGYDNIPPAPAAHVQHMLPLAEARRSTGDLRRRLVARDWQEIVTFSFVSGATEALLDPAPPADRIPIRVLNPIAAHLDVMRTTLLPGLVDTLASNLSHKAPRVRVFEIGRVFGRDGPGFSQPRRAWAAWPTAAPRPNNGARSLERSTFSTSRAISKRWRRRVRSRPKPLLSHGCIPAARRPWRIDGVPCGTSLANCIRVSPGTMAFRRRRWCSRSSSSRSRAARCPRAGPSPASPSSAGTSP